MMHEPNRAVFERWRLGRLHALIVGAAVGLGAWFGLGGCNLVYESEFLVHFDAEAETRAQLVAIDYEVHGGDGTTESSARVRVEDVGGVPTSALPIRPLEGDWHRSFLVTARALRDAGDGTLEAFNERSFRATFAPRGAGGRQEYTLRFSDDCILFQRMCAAEETCVEGRCEPIPFVSPGGPEETPTPIRVVSVDSADGLVAAVADARFGDDIVIEPGSYDVATNLRSARGGSDGAPIVVRAREPGSVVLRYVGTANAEVFVISHPYWVIDGLDIRGACAGDRGCDHAIHVTASARHTILRNNRLADFDQIVHVNPSSDGRTPDDGVLEGNVIEDTRPRPTDVETTVSGLRLYGASRWVVRDNVFRDIFYAEHGSNGVYVVGDVEDLLFERNLIEFGRNVDGGTAYSAFSANTLAAGQLTRLVFRNNVVRQGGLVLQDCQGCRVEHSSVVGDVDVRARVDLTMIGTFATGRRLVAGGSTLDDRGSEFERPLAELVVDPSSDLRPLPGAPTSASGIADDFCGDPRPASATIGALEPTSSCAGTDPPRARRLP